MSTQQQECDRCGREGWSSCWCRSKCIDHDEEVVEVNCQWWGLVTVKERNIMTFFNATEKWVEENAEDVYDEYGRLDNFIDGREEAEEEEWTEYEVESGYMIDEETHGESCSEGYNNKEDAKEYYDMLVRNEDYDYVRLVERTMEGEDCMDDETIEEWKK